MASEIEINQLCRLCLVKEQVNVPIFEEEGDLGQIFLKISACLPVKISRDDSLPKKICDSCSCKLDVVYQFWNTSANSEKQLLKWLNQLGVVNTMTSVNKKNSDSQMAHSINTDTVINLKQEVVELAEHEDDDNMTTEEMDDSNDSENYMLQQQHIPYENFSFQDGFPNEEPSHAVASSTVTSKTVNTRPKRKRRATTKALQAQLDSDDEDDSLLRGKITKTEEQSDSGEDPEPTAFVGLPSTSTDDQPGPSGINKGNAEAPFKDLIQISRNKTPSIETTPRKNNIDAQVKIFLPEPKLEDSQEAVQPRALVSCKMCHILLPLMELDHHIVREHGDKEKNFACDVCGKLFNKNKQRNYHKKIVHGDRNHICSICSKAFATPSGLRRHETYHSSERPWICDFCECSFQNKSALYSHKTKHSESKKYVCDLCYKSFSIPCLLKNHIQSSHNTCVECKFCNETFTNLYHLKKHSRSHRNPSDLQSYVCKICNKVFDMDLSLQRHLLIHKIKDKHMCDLCGKTFSTTTSLRDHKFIHLNIKPFECYNCAKKFNNKNTLKCHVRTHTGEKRYTCPTCEKKFTQRSTLVIHMRMHTGEKPYKCELCEKAFVSRSLLNNHKKNHE